MTRNREENKLSYDVAAHLGALLTINHDPSVLRDGACISASDSDRACLTSALRCQRVVDEFVLFFYFSFIMCLGLRARLTDKRQYALSLDRALSSNPVYNLFTASENSADREGSEACLWLKIHEKDSLWLRE